MKTLIAAGVIRAGVHVDAQRAHAATDRKLTPEEKAKFLKSLEDSMRKFAGQQA